MKKQRLTVLIWSMVILVTMFFLGNHWFYYQMEKIYVGNNILLNGIGIIINILIGLLGFSALRVVDKSKFAWLLFVLSPIWIAIQVVLLKVFGISVDGHVAWHNIGYCVTHYLRYISYMLVLCVPIGIDGLIEKKLKNEEIIFSIISLVNTFLLILSGDLHGTLWCSMFCLLYYFYRGKISLMPIVSVILPMLGALLCKVWDVKSLTVYSASISEYAYRCTFVGLEKAFSGVAVIAVIALYLIIGCLLWKYIQTHVMYENKKRARFLYAAMMITWAINVIIELVAIDIFIYHELPFSSYGSFFWLVPIIVIIKLGQTDMRENV